MCIVRASGVEGWEGRGRNHNIARMTLVLRIAGPAAGTLATPSRAPAQPNPSQHRPGQAAPASVGGTDSDDEAGGIVMMMVGTVMMLAILNTVDGEALWEDTLGRPRDPRYRLLVNKDRKDVSKRWCILENGNKTCMSFINGRIRFEKSF